MTEDMQIWHDSLPSKHHGNVKWNSTSEQEKWRMMDMGCSWTQLFFIALAVCNLHDRKINACSTVYHNRFWPNILKWKGNFIWRYRCYLLERWNCMFTRLIIFTQPPALVNYVNEGITAQVGTNSTINKIILLLWRLWCTTSCLAVFQLFYWKFHMKCSSIPWLVCPCLPCVRSDISNTNWNLHDVSGILCSEIFGKRNQYATDYDWEVIACLAQNWNTTHRSRLFSAVIQSVMMLQVLSFQSVCCCISDSYLIRCLSSWMLCHVIW